MRWIVVVAVVACTVSRADAGRSHFAWLYGTDIVPEKGSELETWIVEENKKGDNQRDETSFWWGPVMALTERLELAIPIEAAFEDEHDGNGGPHFTRWGGEFRYRLQSPDPVIGGPFATLLRFGAKRLIEGSAARRGTRLEGDVVASYQTGRVFLLVDAGAITERVPGANESELRPSAGISIRAAGDLRFGVESYGELIVEGEGTSWFVIGPTISLTSGRFWGAATLGIGLFGLRDAPRVTFGLAL
jgi:hypothetical protein